jgi:phosphoenolpyruvate-protein phosphotransferase (PTS system enzyme I)
MRKQPPKKLFNFLRKDLENSDRHSRNIFKKSTPPKEIVLKGLPASGGIAIGPAYIYEREEVYVSERKLARNEAHAEIALFREAIVRAEEELRETVRYAEKNMNEEATAIFESQIVILHDEEVKKSVERRIMHEKRNADFIIHDEFTKFKSLLGAASEEFKERLVDIDDICQRLLRNLQKKRVNVSIEGKHVIVAQNLTPADTILFSAKNVLGYITEFGGLTSHAAILARSFKLPAIAGMHNVTEHLKTGDLLIIDGQTGKVFVNPSPDRVLEYEEKIAKIRALEKSLEGLAELPCITPDGHKVELSANAEFVDEIQYVLTQGSKGIGLYRTEHLYINKGDFPSEQEQFVAYSEIANMMFPQTVIFRTFDIGGDKFLASDRVEANPFLGWRGSRVMLDKPEVFLQQLRAILKASARKNVKIMFPMISSVTELREAKEHLDKAKESLIKEDVAFDADIEFGIMIEVPSAVIVAEDLAKEVQFFSIGTNDLIQYLLAVDRNNDLISDLYQEFHPAVIKAVKHVIDVGHANDIWVGMCGEMAGNPFATVLLLGLGLDEFSLVPSVLPEIKKIIRTTNYEDALLVSQQALSYKTTPEVKAFLESHAREHYPELFEIIQNGVTDENTAGI